MDIKGIIKKYALQNAIKYGGKANAGAVIGHILATHPELKKEIEEITKAIEKIVKVINSLPIEKQKKELEQLAPELLEKKKKAEKDIFAFLNIKEGEKIVTAFPPEPSKYPHIGHAKALLLNYELAKRYKGKFIIRFEDTNPKLVHKIFYNIHLENYSWLGVKPDKIDYASDHLKEFYAYAKKLIKKGKAYVCLCKQEKIKEYRFKGICCECRDSSVNDNLKRWKDMFSVKEGSAILRLKIDMLHKNTTMRDPTIMRIIDHEHPRTKNKFRVWPNYDFENAIMDGLEGITHRIRSKEFEMRSELQRYIQKLLSFKETFTYEFARFNLQGVESSGRIIREKIKNKELIGWDDPSLTTLVALRRRGFLPEAIKNFVLSTGITKSEAILTWDDLIVHNKRLIDHKAYRYFFIEDPKEIVIQNAPKQTVELDLHPDNKKGGRYFKTNDKFYITKQDYKSLKENKLYRLMDCLNFYKKKNKFIFDSLEYKKYKEKGTAIIHWLPKEKDLINVNILMSDNKLKKGLGEKTLSKVHVGTVVQLTRFGFCRLNSKTSNKLTFWYTHN